MSSNSPYPLQAISGTRTGGHSKEKKRDITIKLGYASAKIYQREPPLPDSIGGNYK
jgi:translation initiation factor 2 gamma subunit (eIF-2gamma)